MTGLIVAAPASGAGKTTVTLALLRLLSREGIAVRGAKSGPDYIDPRFHEAACGAPCLNLDAWAMPPNRLRSLAAGDGLLIVEGAMGLFDGAPPDGKGAVADLARLLHLPVVLVVDAGRMAGSVAALVAGFTHHDPAVPITGIILNNVGSDRHESMLRRALAPLNLPVLAALHRAPDLSLPSRHLGLVQAAERADLDVFLDRAADALATTLDRAALLTLARPLPVATRQTRLAPPAQVIALARDRAFAFCYPHILDDWRAQGAEVKVFSPLADDPVPRADFIYLPGGYPELHAARLAQNSCFKASLRKAAQQTQIYGECGGYMTLGEGLIDADGVRHEMLGLLPLETSFATRKLHLGYRDLTPLRGPFTAPFKAHEFHYATTLRADGPALFSAKDAEGMALPDMGLSLGRVSGSFAHIIDPAG
ncbi:Cobyrinic acid A,C-diamide synthase [Thalassovita gelatinovora]|uniref:Hydrogenobyrinate a,c-diamide synthase n=1 Tax=Thalassovita gelatinovora TaxID=53501 RepID=A0A0P1F551_THAGE|nr:cobyrinate a,c-diamide synthase [Thalassovita gelatinovora]QIZ79512.1 cobyrinate a,c-diamide synthase [Thalassovita gelatinovora]CUH62942.1 Cobyrinic acid A,C-diamide synthase [Thalassovita gelatinovora]SEQ12830.1 cobyrinic acid a,c-diamide synthase [Thalassovita gelatinovora]